jgi:hypothetical protein
MAKLSIWKLKRYLKRVKTAYKKLHKEFDTNTNGNFFYNLHRTETLLTELLSKDKDIDKIKKEIKHNRERQKIIKGKRVALGDRVHQKRKLGLHSEVSNLIHERKLLSKEYGILIDEENEMHREVSKNLPAVRDSLRKDLDKQISILLNEIKLFYIRIGEKIKSGSITNKYVKNYIRPYLRPLTNPHKTFFSFLGR